MTTDATELGDVSPDADRIESWERWLTRAFKEVMVLRDYEASWDQLVDIVDNNRAIPTPNYVMDYIRELYGVAVAVGVRRQSDKDRRVANLRRVIADIREHPEAVRREAFVSRYPEFMRDVGEADFDRFAGASGSVIDTSIITADLAALDASAERVKAFVDKTIAHSEDGATETLTYAELREALESISEMIKRYYLLVHGGALVTTVPTKQYDFLRPLTVPWAPDDRMLRLLRSEHPAVGGADIEREVRGLLDQNVSPTVEQTEGLLALIDALRAEIALRR